ncbi:unnamed protein product [Darwinula stevensoni]|uniref:Uncharacterized protein n=1 Tax=Darwinula stevensoni TaxID=69355 RepID=A0A7R9FU86_9CRUS|nr:unnamed protein product [Darwinula stevensoni]CAG0906559.1 unnamed protein product [Darwinula stevensoni]
MKTYVEAMTKPAACFKYCEFVLGIPALSALQVLGILALSVLQVLGILALGMFREAQGIAAILAAQKSEGRPFDPSFATFAFDIDTANVILGCLLGLFISTLVFPVAILFGHDPGPIDLFHGAVCTLFYLISGVCLLKNAVGVPPAKLTLRVLGSGVASSLLGLVFLADVAVLAFKWRDWPHRFQRIP